MSTSRITVPAAQFAQKVKQRYPQYESVPDELLIRAFLRKNPQYRGIYQGGEPICVSWERPVAMPSVQDRQSAPVAIAIAEEITRPAYLDRASNGVPIANAVVARHHSQEMSWQSTLHLEQEPESPSQEQEPNAAATACPVCGELSPGVESLCAKCSQLFEQVITVSVTAEDASGEQIGPVEVEPSHSSSQGRCDSELAGPQVPREVGAADVGSAATASRGISKPLRTLRVAAYVGVGIAFVGMVAMIVAGNGVTQSVSRELLWDFAANHSGPNLKAALPVDVARETVAELQREVNMANPSRDAIHITSFLKGRFIAGQGGEQVLMTLVQRHTRASSSSNESTYFAVVQAGKTLGVFPAGGLNTILRVVRIPDANVDYVLAAKDSSNQATEIANAQVVSIEDGKHIEVIDDLGVVHISSCGTGLPQRKTVAARIYFQSADTGALKVFPYEHFVAPCEDGGSSFRLLKTSADDSQAVFAAMIQADENQPSDSLFPTVQSSSAEPSNFLGRASSFIDQKTGSVRSYVKLHCGFCKWP